jgi:hypothetical protein
MCFRSKRRTKEEKEEKETEEESQDWREADRSTTSWTQQDFH